MKIMSIIGIVWFSLSLLLMITLYPSDLEAAYGWGLLGILYAIPFSIVGLVKSNQNNKDNGSVYKKLLELSELKEKGFFSDDEFNAMKIDILENNH